MVNGFDPEKFSQFVRQNFERTMAETRAEAVQRFGRSPGAMAGIDSGERKARESMEANLKETLGMMARWRAKTEWVWRVFVSLGAAP